MPTFDPTSCIPADALAAAPAGTLFITSPNPVVVGLCYSWEPVGIAQRSATTPRYWTIHPEGIGAIEAHLAERLLSPRRGKVPGFCALYRKRDDGTLEQLSSTGLELLTSDEMDRKVAELKGEPVLTMTQRKRVAECERMAREAEPVAQVTHTESKEFDPYALAESGAIDYATMGGYVDYSDSEPATPAFGAPAATPVAPTPEELEEAAAEAQIDRTRLKAGMVGRSAVALLRFSKMSTIYKD